MRRIEWSYFHTNPIYSRVASLMTALFHYRSTPTPTWTSLNPASIVTIVSLTLLISISCCCSRGTAISSLFNRHHHHHHHHCRHCIVNSFVSKSVFILFPQSLFLADIKTTIQTSHISLSPYCISDKNIKPLESQTTPLYEWLLLLSGEPSPCVNESIVTIWCSTVTTSHKEIRPLLGWNFINPLSTVLETCNYALSGFLLRWHVTCSAWPPSGLTRVVFAFVEKEEEEGKKEEQRGRTKRRFKKTSCPRRWQWIQRVTTPSLQKTQTFQRICSRWATSTPTWCSNRSSSTSRSLSSTRWTILTLASLSFARYVFLLERGAIG